MDDSLKARFRAFADSWNDDDQVDENGLTGADLKRVAEYLRGVVMVERITLGPQE
ncbi:hypothetical protein [Sphingobium sp. BS19]|uniref:hypothetical protein n=1 Tax=Sphingobium sp. BS19 TaxID=3018973 RepID=UPI0022EEC345|nr:hypothetical protein [Sphingobium sp. BS19]GLI99105.1 hypothetical protein Sbs19_29230 [Sphingobium sp. BS19]